MSTLNLNIQNPAISLWTVAGFLYLSSNRTCCKVNIFYTEWEGAIILDEWKDCIISRTTKQIRDGDQNRNCQGITSR